MRFGKPSQTVGNKTGFVAHSLRLVSCTRHTTPPNWNRKDGGKYDI